MMKNTHCGLELFPATIAVERMEARKASERAMGTSYPRSKSVRADSFLQQPKEKVSYVSGFKSFPSIEWENDEGQEPCMEILSARSHCVNPPTSFCTKSRGADTMAKRKMKINGCTYLLSAASARSGLVRSRRIATKLCLLNMQEEGSYSSRSREGFSSASSDPAKTEVSTSAISVQANIDLEKRLQMSFCEDMMGDTSVTLVA